MVTQLTVKHTHLQNKNIRRNEIKNDKTADKLIFHLIGASSGMLSLAAMCIINHVVFVEAIAAATHRRSSSMKTTRNEAD